MADKLGMASMELMVLLHKYDAAIIRSAGEGNRIVLSVNDGDVFREMEFEEDILPEDICDCRYVVVGSCLGCEGGSIHHTCGKEPNS